MAIYTLGSAREKFDVSHEVAPQLNSYVGYWNVIHRLTKIRYVGRNRFKRRSFLL